MIARWPSPGPCASIVRVAVAALLVAGCDLRIVELLPAADAATKLPDAAPAPDAGTMPIAECKTFTRDDGAACRICFDANGMASAVTCGSPPSIPPGMPVGPGAVTCRVTVEGTERCALCPSPMDNMPQMTCLKCEAPAASSDGGQCRVCTWSDNPMLRCLQCFDATGARREDSCDSLRREMLVYPSPSPNDEGATP